jgi:precorrin-6B methylase 2
MLRSLKILIIRLFEGTELLMLYSLRYHSYLADIGWFNSWKKQRPVGPGGDPLPWFTYPAISFLDRRLRSEMVVFEYGCGNSTYWWAARVAAVYSCEHDFGWYEAIRNNLPPNAHLSLCSGDDYVEAIHRAKSKFDLVVIDGRQRVKCMMTCLSALKDDGVIVVDNSDLIEYENGSNFLRENGFKEINFDGPGPVTANSWRTSIFYRSSQNVFDI